MPGSSRELQRSLDAAFATWDPNWDVSPSQTTSALYAAIEAYNDKHSSVSNISTNLGDTLRSCYLNHVRNHSDVCRLVFFVDILTKLVLLLAEEDVRPWIHTYLRPALNSAGLDLTFVYRTRQFLLALAVPSRADDVEITRKRQDSANLVLDYVTRAYVGEDKEISQILGVDVVDELSNTHEHIERLRFIERNAGILLRDAAQKTPAIFSVLNKHFVISSHRHKVLVILADFCSGYVPFGDIGDCDLLPNLVRSLLYDSSESVLTSELYVYVMLVAKVYIEILHHLPDIFAVVFRLMGWKESHQTQKLEYKEQGMWDTLEVDLELPIMQTHLFINDDYNLQYLMTILYGLFPHHVIQFSTSPLTYWKINEPSLISLEQIESWISSLPSGLVHEITDKVKLQCRRFMMHPNILLNTTMSDEIAHPTKWICKNPSEDDIVLACYQLNPDIMLTIPDNVVLSKWMVDRITHNLSENWMLHSPRENSLGFLPHPDSTRNSLLNERIKNNSPWEVIDRRVSIVPTKLVLDSGNGTELQDGVTFRPFNFGSSTEGLEAGTLNEANEPKKKGSISELYLMHERLFTGANAGLDVKYPIATGNMLTNGKTATDLLSELQEGEKDIKDGNGKDDGKIGNDGRDTTFNGRPGNALDFYQRELLLMKNALEFSSYMKHLNKFNYLKVKLQLNALRAHDAKVKRLNGKNESEVNEQDIAETESRNVSGTLIKPFTGTSESDHSASGQKGGNANSDKFNSDILAENESPSNAELSIGQPILSILSNRVIQLQETIDLLQDTIANLSLEVSESKKDAATAREDAVTSSSHFHKLQCELQVLQAEYKALLSRPKEMTPSPQTHPTPIVNDHDKAVFDLNTQVKMFKDENTRLASELAHATETFEFTKKAYEQKLASANLEKGQAARVLASHYERTIQELHLALAKFEAALEERNARILQLSTSKPIRIPEAEHQTRPRFRSVEDNDYFASSSIDSSLSSNPSRPTITTPRPSSSSTTVLRGRGGYQKRSKKM